MFKRLATMASTAGLILAVACSQSDSGITTAVKSKLAADDTVKAYQIDVDTRDGTVTLGGMVPSKAEADRAVAIARDTSGVKSVVNNLRIGR